MISIIGSGRIGSSVALRLAEKELSDILLVDIVEGLPKGESLDLMEASHGYLYDVDVRGTADYSEISNSNLIIVTAGSPRKTGMSRLELTKCNAPIITDISKKIKRYASDAIVVIITNPVDIMTYIAYKNTGFERERVIGMGSLVDCIRFEYFIARALGTSVRDVHALVIGEHGDTMVPLPRYTSAAGIPVTELLSEKEISLIIKKTLKSGAKVIALKGGTSHAPSAAVAMLVESIVKNYRRILPASIYLNGEYGHRNICIGVPAVIGKKGAEKIVKLDLNTKESKMLDRSATTIKDCLKTLGA